MSNYPDDIRQYDDHPNSPFYEEPDDDETEDDGDYETYTQRRMREMENETWRP